MSCGSRRNLLPSLKAINDFRCSHEKLNAVGRSTVSNLSTQSRNLPGAGTAEASTVQSWAGMKADLQKVGALQPA